MCESIHLNTGSTTAHLTSAGLLGNAIVNVTTSNSTPSTSSLSSQPCCSSTPTPIAIPIPTPSSSLSTSTTLLLTPAGCVGSSCASTSCSRRNSSSSSSSCTSSASSVSSNLSSSTVATTSSTSTMGTSSSSALDFDIDIESGALPIVNNNLSCSTMEKAGCVPVRRRRVRNNHNSNNNNNNNNSNKNNHHNVGGGHGYVWEVMLVQSLGTPCRWAFPKGSVEPDETPAAAAVRETAEEGGVFGQLGPNLGLWALKRKRLKFQSMWLLLVHTEYAPDSLLWKEGARRSRVWLSFDAARALLSHTPPHARRPELLEMLDSAKAALNLSASTYPSRSLLTIPRDDGT